MTTLVRETHTLIHRAMAHYSGAPAAELAAALERLDQPLRVAIAGKVKAGKSTLLNALVGDQLAPTDAGECTRIVTWYRDGHTYLVEAALRDGSRRQLRFHRDHGAIEPDLSDLDNDTIESLQITWPSKRLAELTLIDTPGIESISTSVSQRSIDFLTGDDQSGDAADAVLYLMRHMHRNDVRFLESFHDDELAQASPVNAIGILSRADEIGSCRLDAMESASNIAARYRSDPKLRKLCQTVVPVAGLLAQAAVTSSEAEFRAFGQLAIGADSDALTLTADRFKVDDPSLPVTAVERELLLDRFGLYGVRIATDLIKRRGVSSASELADALLQHSGMPQLREALLERFAGRADTLRARTALRVLETVLLDHPVSGTDEITLDLERILAGAHELSELRLLNQLHTGVVQLRGDEVDHAEQLVTGATPSARLGLSADTPVDEIRTAAYDQLGRWQARAENPMSSQPVKDASRVLIRSIEGVLARLQ